MFDAAKSPSLATLAGITQVALALHCALGRRLLLQVEALLGQLLLPVAEGKGQTPVELQQAALEVRRGACRAGRRGGCGSPQGAAACTDPAAHTPPLLRCI
jgi:hypothetical protein